MSFSHLSWSRLFDATSPWIACLYNPILIEGWGAQAGREGASWWQLVRGGERCPAGSGLQVEDLDRVDVGALGEGAAGQTGIDLAVLDLHVASLGEAAVMKIEIAVVGQQAL